MSTVVYKRLFEVRILHDYYLSKPDLTSLYALSTADQLNFLNDRLTTGQYDVRQYLDVMPAEATRTFMRNHHIRMTALPSGFLVGMEVTPQITNTGEEEYLPVIPVSPDLHLTFHLKAQTTRFSTFTNLKMRRADPAHYYFSNTNEDGLKVYPSLSRPVAPFRLGTTYETGELAVVKNELQEAQQETASLKTSFWKPVGGSGFANEQDRLLLPKRYAFTFFQPMSNLVATLRQADGSAVKNISFGAAAASRIYLDFQQTVSGVGEAVADIPDGLYQLELTSDNGSETRSVYLSDEAYQRADAALITIDAGVTDPAFRVVNDDGTLITRRKANGTLQPHPVYEIRFKRRSTYWRYRSDSGVPLATTAQTSSFLSEQDGHLITQEPRPLTRFFTAFAFDDPNTDTNESIYLPNPTGGMVRQEAKKLISDIYVSPIKGLIKLK